MPTPKALEFNARSGALYGAATGFAVGLVWQAVAMYDNPLALWRWLIVAGAVVGGSLGFGYSRSGRRPSPSPEEPEASD